ncbi:WYL domain-containing protein [Deinococcus sp. YIM 134068]|uniref:helix-turn-helix transcriptional regulator n=1 Tax=Deinococcus lichenicola TaxID=3118910 RepID=UPI002F92B263
MGEPQQTPPDLSPTPPPRRPRPRQSVVWDRAKRLTELEAKLRLAPHTTAQLAGAFGVTRRSIQRDLDALREMNRDVIRDGRGAYHIPTRGRALRPVEALAIYSAVRLLHHHAPGTSGHYLSALETISQGLPQHLRHLLHASLLDTGAAHASDRALDLIAAAWMNREALRFDYRRPNGEVERGNELHVYFVEISRDNLAPYAIGLETRHRGAVRTFKVSRMDHLARLPGGYEIPDSFNPRDYLTDAWGVIGGGQPITVRVRFAPEAAYRVREGGYPNTTLLPREDGSVELDIRACPDRSGLPRELIPFLLGWGPRVEVLSPPHVRAHWLGELRAALARHDPDFRVGGSGDGHSSS